MMVAASPNDHELPDHSVTTLEARSIAAPIFEPGLRCLCRSGAALMMTPFARRERAAPLRGFALRRYEGEKGRRSRGERCSWRKR